MSPTGHDSNMMRLLRQNKDLQEVNEMLTSENRALLEEIERLKKQITDKELNEKKEGVRTVTYKMATLLFVEILGFQKITDTANSQELVDQLDDIKFHFDSIIEKHKIQKIRTLGDSFMCAGGIPEKNITNPLDVVLAAFEMQQYMHSIQGKKKIWKLRMGVHTGPVTATITGTKKLNYDLKGETVNIASRLQASTEAGKPVISAMTYEMVKDFFNLEFYTEMPVKYMGKLGIYQVNGIRKEFAENPVTPNRRFMVRYCMRQFTDLQEMILDRLEKELPHFLYYHNVKHTVDVVTEVELIALAEGVREEEILLLKTAALFHDTGHIKGYDNHELYGTQIAKDILPSFHYFPDQIEKICQIIMATKVPPKPTCLLEEIICDADLDYLGRPDFIPVSNDLYRELKEQNKIGTLNDWNKLQVKFITNHTYFTKTARRLREVNKSKQIERLTKLITED